MKTWVEFEAKFREIAEPLQYHRIDFQWGAAGEHWNLCGRSVAGIDRQFEGLAELAGKALIECAIHYPELFEIVTKDKEPRLIWYRALKELSKEFKVELIGSQQNDDGSDAGTIYIGRINNIGVNSANLCLFLEARYPVKIESLSNHTEINITNSNIGVVNTGNIANIDSITLNINTLNTAGASEAADAFKEIVDAINRSTDLSQSLKLSVLEQLEELSRQATLSNAERSKPGVLRAVVSTIAGTLGAAGALAEVWSTWGPTIIRYLGL